METISKIRSRYSDLYFAYEKVGFNKFVAVTVIEDEKRRSYLLTPSGSKEIAERDIGRLPITRSQNLVKLKKLQQKAAALTYIAVIGLLGTLGILLVSGLLQTRVVLTGSMVPTIKPGDIVLATPPSNISPSKGKIIIYTPRRLDGSTVGSFAHRVIGGDATNGWVVKGDANPSPDEQHPKQRDITGVVLFVIPYLGKILTPQMLSLALLFGFAIWLIVDAFSEPN